MAISVNTVVIGGNVTRDPQVRFLANETCVANFGVAVNETWKNKAGEKQEKCTFVEIEVWQKTAELCGQYLHKGDPVLVEGKLTQDTYEDKDGKKQTKTRVKADRVHFLGSKREGADRDENKAVTVKPTKADPVAPKAEDSEVPF